MGICRHEQVVLQQEVRCCEGFSCSTQKAGKVATTLRFLWVPETLAVFPPVRRWLAGPSALQAPKAGDDNLVPLLGSISKRIYAQPYSAVSAPKSSCPSLPSWIFRRSTVTDNLFGARSSQQAFAASVRQGWDDEPLIAPFHHEIRTSLPASGRVLQRSNLTTKRFSKFGIRTCVASDGGQVRGIFNEQFRKLCGIVVL